MSASFVRTAFGVALLSLPLPTFAAAAFQDPIAKEIMRLEDAWAAGEAKKDGAAVGRLLAETFRSPGADGTVETKAQRVKSITEGKAIIVSEANSDYQVDVYGSTAVITGLTTIVTKEASGNVTQRYRWTDTWLKQADGRWLCVAAQSTQVPR